MKRIAASFLLTAGLALGDVSDARKAEIASELRLDKFLNVRKYSSEERAWVEHWILNVVTKEPGIMEESYHRQLLQLGHRPTIEKYGELIAHGGSSNYTQGSAQPRLIKYYESQLLIEEPAWMPQIYDTTGWRASIQAAGGVLGLLHHSEELPAPVRLWARELLRQIDEFGSDEPRARKGLEEARSIVREWWKENKMAVLEERFGGVKSGELHSYIQKKHSKEEPMAAAGSVIKSTVPFPTLGDQANTRGLKTSPIQVAPQESGWYWAASAVCITLLGALYAIFRKRA